MSEMLILDSKQQKMKLRRVFGNKKYMLDLSLSAKGMNSLPTVKKPTDYISLAITPLLKPLQGIR